MYCSNCGEQLPDNAKFCDQCGAQLGVVLVERIVEKEVPIEVQREEVKVPQMSEKKKRKRKRLAIPEMVLSLALFVIVTFLPIYSYEYYYEDVYFYKNITVFGTIEEDVTFGMFHIVGWLLGFAAVICYVRLGQLEKYGMSCLCVLFVAVIIFIVVGGTTNYYPITPSGEIEKFHGGDPGAVLIPFALLPMFVIPIVRAFNEISINRHTL